MELIFLKGHHEVGYECAEQSWKLESLLGPRWDMWLGDSHEQQANGQEQVPFPPPAFKSPSSTLALDKFDMESVGKAQM